MGIRGAAVACARAGTESALSSANAPLPAAIVLSPRARHRPSSKPPMAEILTGGPPKSRRGSAPRKATGKPAADHELQRMIEHQGQQDDA